MKYQLTSLLILSIVFHLDAHAGEYQHGHHALEIFDAQGIEATPFWVMAWIVLSTACFTAGLLLVWRHSVARWVVGCYIAGFMALIASSVFDSDILRLAGFNALIHVIFWPPALYQLLSKRPFLSKKVTVFSIWSGVITAVILVSYSFDIPYSFIYLKHVFFHQ